MEPSSSAVPRLIIVFLPFVCFLILSALVFAVWKLRRNRCQNKKHQDKGPEEGTEETELLVNGQENMEDLDDGKLKEQVEEKMAMTDVISVLTEKKLELEHNRDKLMSQIERLETERTENEKKLNPAGGSSSHGESSTAEQIVITTGDDGRHSQSQVVVGPSQPIVVTAGDDIILPCQIEPAVDASVMTVEWTRPDLNPRFVHVWRDGVELENKKHPSYNGRTSVFVNKLRCGDISLNLSKVRLSDSGKYRCFIPTLGRESTVELVVGVVSSIVISSERTGKDEVSSRVVLQCESAGWYPEPEVFWLD
ncbi:butyrophilin-like protein 2, partial [Sparus aurata]|uniref:butyrophilin-like protein 2 n=1 Tax=Sparus aurata TaxID=8175 RepID=UPI0011C1B9B2